MIILLIAWWKTPRILNPMNCLEAGIRPMDALNESRYTRRGMLAMRPCKSDGEHGSTASIGNRQFVQTIFATVGSRHLVPHLVEKQPVASTVQSNLAVSPLMDVMDKWDEARVGFADREKDKEVHPGHVFKYGIPKVGRR